MGNVTNTVSELQANVLTSRMVRKTLANASVQEIFRTTGFDQFFLK